MQDNSIHPEPVVFLGEIKKTKIFLVGKTFYFGLAFSLLQMLNANDIIKNV